MADVVGDVLALGRRSDCDAVGAVVGAVVVVVGAAVVIRRVASWRCHGRMMVMMLGDGDGGKARCCFVVVYCCLAEEFRRGMNFADDEKGEEAMFCVAQWRGREGRGN